MSSKDVHLHSSDDLTMEFTSDQKLVNLEESNLELLNLELEAFRRAIEYMKTVPCANAANAELFDPAIEY